MSRKKEVTIGITINLENYENLRLEVLGDVETYEDVDDLITFLDGMLARLGRGDPATAERVDAYRDRVLTMRPERSQAPEHGTAAAEAVVPMQQQILKTPLPAPEGVAATTEAKAKPAPGSVAATTEAKAQPASEGVAATTEAKAKPAPGGIATTTEAKAKPAPGGIATTTEAKATPAPGGVAATTEAKAQPAPKPAPGGVAATTEAKAQPAASGADDVCEVCGVEVTKSQAKLSKLFMNKILCKKCMEQP